MLYRKSAFTLFGLFLYFFSLPIYSEVKPKLTLIWQANPGIFFEYDWFHYLLSNFEVEEIYDPTFESLEDGCMIVAAEYFIQPQLEALQKAKREGVRFGIFHISDEAYNSNINFYSYASLVYRQYYHPIVEQCPNIFCIPLGCKRGFKINQPYNLLPDISNRPYQWSFVGQVTKSTRKLMHQEMVSLNFPSYTHFNSNFNSPDGLSTQAYQNIMEKTLFAPCPCGWVNLDSFRLYEALECGCIPIVELGKNNYFYNLYKNPPFIICKTWSDAPKIVKDLLNNPDQLETLRKECFDWWANYKLELKKKIFNDVSHMIRNE